MALRDLVQGMTGEDVRAVQRGLNEYFQNRRPTLVADGNFGSHTREAVDAFQSENPGTGRPDGTPDGVVGSATRRKLFPLAVVTVSVVGLRLGGLLRPRFGGQRPTLLPGTLQPPTFTLNPNANVLNIDWQRVMQPARISFTPQRFPGLRLPLVTPPVFLAPRPTPTGLFTFAHIHHWELSPGMQMMLPNPGQTSFTLGLQAVAMIGDEHAGHQEFAMGTQLGSQNIDGSGDWSFTWYAQITDVDRFGSLGLFHWWQPYAQLGIQNSVRTFNPVITGNLFPVNLGFDLNDSMTINIGGGVALIYDPQTGAVQAGIQGTAGLVIKFDGSPGSH